VESSARVEGASALDSSTRVERERVHRRSIAADDNFSSAYDNLGHLLYVVRKRYAAAEEAYEKAIAANPRNSRAHNNYGVRARVSR